MKERISFEEERQVALKAAQMVAAIKVHLESGVSFQTACKRATRELFLSGEEKELVRREVNKIFQDLGLEPPFRPSVSNRFRKARRSMGYRSREKKTRKPQRPTRDS